MRILIGYDGSNLAEAALSDLKKAGLGNDVDALIMTVAEIWLPPPKAEAQIARHQDGNITTESRKLPGAGEKSLHEAKSLVRYAEHQLKQSFPSWKIRAEAAYGSPFLKIIAGADEWGPDLIVLGSHGRGAAGRLVLGSISQCILTEASCSVRVARIKTDKATGALRLIIGYDGSKGADKAIEEVAKRKWPEGSEVRIITIDDPLMPMAIGRFVEPVASWVAGENRQHRDWIRNLADISVKKLKSAGLRASHSILEGNPKQVLTNEANLWEADCIFLGATGFSNQIDRFLLGSVSSSVAARSACSVEIVRSNKTKLRKESNNGIKEAPMAA